MEDFNIFSDYFSSTVSGAVTIDTTVVPFRRKREIEHLTLYTGLAVTVLYGVVVPSGGQYNVLSETTVAGFYRNINFPKLTLVDGEKIRVSFTFGSSATYVLVVRYKCSYYDGSTGMIAPK